MPSPYKTNCFDYNKIGCKSRRDCIDRCNIEWALINCNNSSPENTIVDKHNDKDIFKGECDDNNKEFCENKYKSPDCFNEYYKIQLVSEIKYDKISTEGCDKFLQYVNNSTFKLNNKNAKIHINLISMIFIDINKEPDTIYTHSPQQHPIECICFIGGVISLWTGFSVISIYAYGKRFFGRNQNKVELIKRIDEAVNNRKRYSNQ